MPSLTRRIAAPAFPDERRPEAERWPAVVALVVWAMVSVVAWFGIFELVQFFR